jgi:hypothetical protein
VLYSNLQLQFRAAETDGEATLEERNKTINAHGIFDGARNFERNMQVRYNQSRQVSLGSEEATEVGT